MAVSEEYRQFVEDQLADLGEIRSRRMFGGLGVYCDELFFALVDNDTLYLKVDDSNRDDFERLGLSPFQPYPSKPGTMPYYPVPVDVLEDRDELARWAQKAVEVAARKKKK